MTLRHGIRAVRGGTCVPTNSAPTPTDRQRWRYRRIGRGATRQKRTPPFASSSGCGHFRVVAARGPRGSRGPRGVGRGRTVEALGMDRAQVGDLPLAQFQSLQLLAGQLGPDLVAV